MTLNKLLMASSVMALGLSMATSAMAVGVSSGGASSSGASSSGASSSGASSSGASSSGASSSGASSGGASSSGASSSGASSSSGGASIPDTGLGFGKFLGTWKNQSPQDDNIAETMPNPNGNAKNVEEVGNAILAQYPGLFEVDEFNLAGMTDSFIGDNSNPLGVGFRVDSKLDGYTAKWTYDGFPVGEGSPGMEPVDLFIAVKYGDFTSMFLFSLVDPDTDNDGFADGVFGYLSSDFATILANTEDSLETGLNYDGFTSACILGGDNVSTECMMYNPTGKNPMGVSHVVGYWPPVGLVPPLEVPEPGSLTLLGAGLLGLGYFGRRRKAA